LDHEQVKIADLPLGSYGLGGCLSRWDRDDSGRCRSSYPLLLGMAKSVGISMVVQNGASPLKMIWCFAGVLLLSVAASLWLPGTLALSTAEVDATIMLVLLPVCVLFAWRA
jgi:hypothetical protein